MSATGGLDWVQILRTLGLLGLAYLLALPIAYNRERQAHSAGLRTFPLVAVAACGFTLIALSEFPGPDAVARVVQGIVTGIGFIGGGAILKRSESEVRGTATAASIWATGGIGVAVAFHRFEIAAALALLTFLTFLLMKRFKTAVDHEGVDPTDSEE